MWFRRTTKTNGSPFSLLPPVVGDKGTTVSSPHGRALQGRGYVCGGVPGGQHRQDRPGEEGEFVDLGIAVVELVGRVGELEDLAVAEERLVVAKGFSLPHR